MIKSLGPPRFKYFHPSACNVCRAFGKEIKLKRCSSCKMIAYCSREHQSEDWPRHKEMCRVFSRLEKDRITQKIEKSLKNRVESWMEARHILLQLIPNLLGRELSRFEKEMFIHSRSCEICHETDIRILNDCTECPDASFCIKHPRDNGHTANCETFKLSFEALNLTALLDFPDKIVQQNYGKSIPKNMDHATSLLLPHCTVNDEISIPTKIRTVFVSRSLTRPYTFLFSMAKLSLPKLSKITVHVVGASYSEMINTHLWQYLFHHDQSLKEIKIIFVGPDLSTDSKVIELCEKCIKSNRKINVITVGNLYANFANGQFFSKPDYVIGFNLGIAADYYDGTWAPTIKLLSKLSCPFSVTSYFENESKDNEEIINSILEKKIEPVWTGRNLFSSLQPVRSADHDQLFCYDNHYLTVYDKLS